MVDDVNLEKVRENEQLTHPGKPRLFCFCVEFFSEHYIRVVDRSFALY